MKSIRLILILLFVQAACFPSLAKLKKLDLVTNNTTLTSKIYSQIQIIDDRPETEIKELSIDDAEISKALNEKLTKEGGSKILSIQIKKLYLLKDNQTNKNKYVIQARAYERNLNKKESFFWLNTLNTSLPNSYSDLETNKMLSSIITEFIADQLSLLPYSYAPQYETSDFENIAYLEKTKIAAYKTNDLKDGIYYTYASFANQDPSAEMSSFKFNRDTSLKDVYYFDTQKNEEKKINKKDIFGVVIEGDLFITNKNKFVALYRDDDNDYYFKIKTASTGGFGFGLSIGAFGGYVRPSTTTTEEDKTVIIDHLSGELSLKSKKIKKTKANIFSKNAEVTDETVEGDGSLKKSW